MSDWSQDAPETEVRTGISPELSSEPRRSRAMAGVTPEVPGVSPMAGDQRQGGCRKSVKS